MLPLQKKVDRLADEAYKIARRWPRRSATPQLHSNGDDNDENGDGGSDGNSDSGRNDVCDEGVRKRE